MLGWRIILAAVHSHPPLPQEIFLLLVPTGWACCPPPRLEWNCSRLEQEASFTCFIQVEKLPRGFTILSSDPKKCYSWTDSCWERRIKVCQCAVCKEVFPECSSANTWAAQTEGQWTFYSLPNAILDVLVTEEGPFPGKFKKLYINCASSQIKRVIFEEKKNKNLSKPVWILCFDQGIGPETSWDPSNLNYPVIFIFFNIKNNQL